jgi:hypothetical protein
MGVKSRARMRLATAAFFTILVGAKGALCAEVICESLFKPRSQTRFEKTSYFGDGRSTFSASSLLGPARSPGLYFAGVLSTEGLKPKLPWLLRLREHAIESMPNAEGWRGRFDSLTLQHRLSDRQVVELGDRYNEIVSLIYRMKWSESLAVALKERKNEIIFLASRYPEVHSAIERIFLLGKSIPSLAHGDTWLVRTAIASLKEGVAKPLGAPVTSIAEYSFRREIRNGNIAAAMFDLETVNPNLAIFILASVMDVYLYGTARYANELHLVEESPLARSLIKAFQATDWRPVEPERSLRDIEFLASSLAYGDIRRVIKDEAGYVSLVRRFIVYPESFAFFAQEWSGLMIKHSIPENYAESNLYSSEFVSETKELVGKIASRWPEVDRPGSELTQLNSLIRPFVNFKKL